MPLRRILENGFFMVGKAVFEVSEPENRESKKNVVLVTHA